MIMKKIFSFILLLAGVTMVTSCGEDDATYTPVEPLEIVSNNVLFETAGGTGTITVKGSEALTASTAAQWLAVSVSGYNNSTHFFLYRREVTRFNIDISFKPITYHIFYITIKG